MAADEPLRVLQVVASMGHGGIEHFLMSLYRAVDKRKVQFDFMYRVPEECIFDKEIESMGGRIFRCIDPDRRPIESSRYYKSFFVHHPEIKVIHEHRSGCEGFFGLMREAKRAGVPLRILHSHNSQKGWSKNPIKDITDSFNASRLCDFANTFIACSDLAASHLYGRCPNALNECIVRPNAIDLGRFAFDSKARKRIRGLYNIPDDTLVIVHVGRFVPEKNQMFLVDIVAHLLARGVHVAALLLGDGPLREATESKAHALGVLEHINFVGIQQDTASFYSAADVFCMPSIFEGLPVSCVEAQANGLSMVLSTGITQMADICGCSKFLDLEHGVVAWGDAIIASATNNRCGNIAALRAAGYDIDTAARDYEMLYLGGDFV